MLFDLVEGGNLLESMQTVCTLDHRANVGRVPEFVDTIANLDIATIVGPFVNKEGSSQQGLFDIFILKFEKIAAAPLMTISIPDLIVTTNNH